MDINTPLFEIKAIPDKGRGLIASTDIPRGTRILREKPLFNIAAGPRGQEFERAIATKLKQLPKEQQRQFLSLHNNYPGQYPFSGIVKTNALPCGPGASVGGLYSTACLINHSCIPNAHHSWNHDTAWETIHTVQDIKAGEEITINYSRDGPRAVRQAFLKMSFGFDCTCPTCAPLGESTSEKLEASDARRRLIQTLDERISDPVRMMTRPKDTLADCHSLLQLLYEEFNGCAVILVARANYDAFQVCVAHGDQARAAVFAQRAYEARVVCEGEDSPDTKRMKASALKPSDHSSAGAYGGRWKTKMGMVPNLDVEQFEKWLFRE